MSGEKFNIIEEKELAGGKVIKKKMDLEERKPRPLDKRERLIFQGIILFMATLCIIFLFSPINYVTPIFLMFALVAFFIFGQQSKRISLILTRRNLIIIIPISYTIAILILINRWVIINDYFLLTNDFYFILGADFIVLTSFLLIYYFDIPNPKKKD